MVIDIHKTIISNPIAWYCLVWLVTAQVHQTSGVRRPMPAQCARLANTVSSLLRTP